MRAYRLTPQARDGFFRIVMYVEGRFGLQVVDRVVGEFEVAFELIAKAPDIGHRRDDLTADERVRFWSVGPTLIAYRTTDEVVEILFVERGAVDWDRLLEEHLE